VFGGLFVPVAIALDLLQHPQRTKIMNIVWPITGLYLPIVGVALRQFESVEVVGWARYKWSATVSYNRLCQRHIVPAAALLAI